MSKYKLTTNIISNSQSNTWDKAKLEWDLYAINMLKDPTSCLCGHYPINEECIIKNKLNNKTLSVGNCCVKKFLKNIETTKLFQTIKRVTKDINKSFNPTMIEYATNKKWISDRDQNFYVDIWRKINLSEAQLKWKLDINKKIIKNFKN